MRACGAVDNAYFIGKGAILECLNQIQKGIRVLVINKSITECISRTRLSKNTAYKVYCASKASRARQG